MSRDDDATPTETPLPRLRKTGGGRYDFRCDAHESLVSLVDRIDERTGQIKEVVDRIERRVYDGHGVQAQTSSAVSTALKIAGIVIGAGAAIGAISAALIALAQ